MTELKTIVELYNDDNRRSEVMERAGEILKKGGLVAFPTETVYGLGGDALNPEASARIYAAKGGFSRYSQPMWGVNRSTFPFRSAA